MSHCPSQFDEQPVVARRDADRPVGGLENLVGRQGGARRAMPLRHLAGDGDRFAVEVYVIEVDPGDLRHP